MAILHFILTLFIGQKPVARKPIQTTEYGRSILLSANGRFCGILEVLS